MTVHARTQLVIYDDSFSAEFGKSDFLDVQVSADLMLNKVKFVPKGKDGKPAETSSCIHIRTQRMNQLKATIFRPQNID